MYALTRNEPNAFEFTGKNIVMMIVVWGLLRIATIISNGYSGFQ